MGLFKWLSGLFSGGDNNKEESTVLDLSDRVVTKVVTKKVKSTEGYVDDVTGKVYKTAGALKGAQTRRKNKAKKSKKTKK